MVTTKSGLLLSVVTIVAPKKGPVASDVFTSKCDEHMECLIVLSKKKREDLHCISLFEPKKIDLKWKSSDIFL